MRTLDISEDLVLDQGVIGTKETKHKLGLIRNECYCLGGPGVIMSRSVLKKIGPNLDSCLRETVTREEDVELGRCIRKYAGVSCLWTCEVSTHTPSLLDPLSLKNGLAFHKFYKTL